MAIKDGVPQWDSQSYKYVSQRQRPRSEILGMSYPYNLMTKLLESSFIGQGNGNGDVQGNGVFQQTAKDNFLLAIGCNYELQ